MTIRLHDTELGTTTNHRTIREAKKALAASGWTPGRWWRTELEDGAVVWEKAGDDRDLSALVWNAKHDNAIREAFGILF